MNEKDFHGLLQGVREAGAYVRGNRAVAAKIDRIDPGSVAAIRTRLKLSQKGFSAVFGISTATLRNWEQGRRQPTGAARLLLRVAAKYPRPCWKLSGRKSTAAPQTTRAGTTLPLRLFVKSQDVTSSVLSHTVWFPITITCRLGTLCRFNYMLLISGVSILDFRHGADRMAQEYRTKMDFRSGVLAIINTHQYQVPFTWAHDWMDIHSAWRNNLCIKK